MQIGMLGRNIRNVTGNQLAEHKRKGGQRGSHWRDPIAEKVGDYAAVAGVQEKGYSLL